MTARRHFFVWLSEYPDEGSVCIIAINKNDAKRRCVSMLGPFRSLSVCPAKAGEFKQWRLSEAQS